MIMANPRFKEMTPDEFLIWNLTQDARYELVDGFPVPLRSMAGASDSHDTIVVNIIAALKDQLRGSDCRPSTSDKALRTSIKRVRRPDVTIECSTVDPKSYESRNPIAVFEVLSPTTKKSDRTIKLEEYKRHPTLQTIVHIDPDIMDVLVFTRGANGQWEVDRLDQAEAVVKIAGTPVVLALSDIYDGIPLPTPDAASSQPI